MTIDVLATEAGAADTRRIPYRDRRGGAGPEHLSRRALLLRRFLRDKMGVVGVFMYLFLDRPGDLRPKVLTEWNYTELGQTASSGPELEPQARNHPGGPRCAGDEPAGSRACRC